ncbi:hypothetical protein MUK42_25027 [Musa troglodytarum]|uniref:Uncharacterized protein n=1 Tax=Musa troglodytarum TaxID=320322 RepID=A0A9E7I5B5_9LILI|nr:hypothetical protein MUK42_25027 [Musa troglodytarum]URE42232.1 hypothetical protein MUK42_25027 [Musa troglodytarum]URE42233.1 hypothetical protein MUK42_25027 [Musa troglodytarum]URE42234.1 hypothetical protein MUK42_25027 [Musa troglodytarum]
MLGGQTRKTMHVGMSNSEQPKRAMVAVPHHAGNLFIRQNDGHGRCGGVLRRECLRWACLGMLLYTVELRAASDALHHPWSDLPGFLLVSFALPCTLSVVGISASVSVHWIPNLFFFFLSPPPQIVVFSSTKCIDLECDACRSSMLSRDGLMRGPTSTTNDNDLLGINFFVFSSAKDN